MHSLSRFVLHLALTGMSIQAMPAHCAEPARTTPLDFLPALTGDYFKLDSGIIGRPFHIYVRLPLDYASKPDLRYPVVYLLDGDTLFPLLAPQHLLLTYDEGLPEAVVVGIAYGSFDRPVNQRGFDYSAPGADAGSSQGGAPAFQRFLKTELFAQIEQRYRVDPARRVLFGQSRGGHFVLYSAFTEPDLFWGRIASNPPLDPGRIRFFAPPAPASRTDLGLVVTSSSRDHPDLRQGALAWFAAWQDRNDTAWAVKTVTLENGTHSADTTNSYRAGMLWLFRRDEKK